MQWNTTVTLKNGLEDINRLNLYLRLFQGFFTKKFLNDFESATSSFMDCYKSYIYWDIRRYHCIAWEKIIFNTCIYQPETNTLIGIILKGTIVLLGEK